MANVNKVILIGNLTRDVELRYTPKGMAVGQCGLAVNRTWKSEAGEKQEEVTFIDFTAWGKMAETMSQYLKKGKSVYLEGRLKLDSWEDKQTGAKRQKLSVVVESFQFIGTKSDSDEDSEPRQASRSTPQRQTAEPTQTVDNKYDDDSDVPF